MGYLSQAAEVEVPPVEYKSPIANTPQNLEKLDDILVKKFGKNLKLNKTVMERGGLLPDGSRRVPLAVTTKAKPGGSLVAWVDRSDPGIINVVWSGVITAKLLDEAGIERL
jgi:hypothetical protein